jgi:hypothetical protein
MSDELLTKLVAQGARIEERVDGVKETIDKVDQRMVALGSRVNKVEHEQTAGKAKMAITSGALAVIVSGATAWIVRNLSG